MISKHLRLSICQILILIGVTANTFALPVSQGTAPFKPKPSATFSAYNIHKDKWNRASYLIGNVEVLFKNNIKLNADRMLIKYNPLHPNKIAECIVYGRGLLTIGNHITEFKDGSYFPKKMKLTADSINPLQ